MIVMMCISAGIGGVRVRLCNCQERMRYKEVNHSISLQLLFSPSSVQLQQTQWRLPSLLAGDFDELLSLELSNLEPLSLMTFSGALEMHYNKFKTLTTPGSTLQHLTDLQLKHLHLLFFPYVMPVL